MRETSGRAYRSSRRRPRVCTIARQFVPDVAGSVDVMVVDVVAGWVDVAGLVVVSGSEVVGLVVVATVGGTDATVDVAGVSDVDGAVPSSSPLQPATTSA